MRVSEGERKRMRHSSSWPDRAAQTVKVRVDPLSRAFTIIPAIGGRLHPLLTTTPSQWIDEIVLLDRGGSSSPLEAKRRFVDSSRPIERSHDELGESLELRALLPDLVGMNKSCGTAVNSGGRSEGRKSEGKLEATAASPNDPRCTSEDMGRGSVAQRERDETSERFRSKWEDEEQQRAFLDSWKRGEEEGWTSPRSDASLPPPFEAVVRIETNVDRVDENSGDLSERSSPPRRAANPQIEVVDYDDVTASGRVKHACPKCTSEGLLRERVDPFRSPASSRRSIAGRGDKPETGRKYSGGEGKMRNSWRRIGARGLLIGGGRKKEKGGRRNPVLCRPVNDVRKEATLRRHYYPEGGWGYVIVTCSALVHFLGIGLQLAAPGSWYLTAELVFHQPALHTAGNSSFPPPSLSLSSPRGPTYSREYEYKFSQACSLSSILIGQFAFSTNSFVDSFLPCV